MISKHSRASTKPATQRGTAFIPALCVSFILLLGSGCAPEAPGVIEVIDSSCEELPDSVGEGIELVLQALSREGRELTYTMSLTTFESREATGDDNIDDFDPGLNTRTVVLTDGQLLMLIETRGDATSQEVMVEYGPLITGIDYALAVLQDGVVTGMINDREIVPVPVEELDPEMPEFVDGDPAPVFGIPPDLQEALVALFEAAETASQGCEVQNGIDVVQAARASFQDTGHGSHPTSSSACVGCRGACSGVAAGCVAGFAVGCAASLFFYAACKVPACLGCAIAYGTCFGLCGITGGPCCPVGCGDVACCEVDETCLNFDIGLCCSPGLTTCVGKSCCSDTESCINAGPNAGTCCQSTPEDLRCGDTCCDPGITCCADICCDSGEQCAGETTCCGDPQFICGDACCDELDSCIESLSLCCSFASPACNNKCCEVGESCLGGTNCCPVNLVCGSFCCPQGTVCDSMTNTCEACPNSTDTSCTVGGCCPAGMNCTDFEGICCPQGETFCDGMCKPLSSCLK